MKILFFSDIHGNSYVLDELMNVIDKEEVDKVVFCGDIFGYYYYQEAIINLFRKQGFTALLGNHDQFFLDIIDNISKEEDFIFKYGNSYLNIKKKISQENVAFLRELKPWHYIEDNNIKIGIFHGTPENPLNGRLYPDTTIYNPNDYEKYNIVVLGHTHHKMIKTINRTLILNPGSIGQQRDGKGCSYLVLNTSNRAYHFGIINYNVDSLAYDIECFDNGCNKLKEVLYRKVVV